MKYERTQPVCEGVDAAGELVWGLIPMPRWQMEMYRIHYKGDFGEQWMYLIASQKSGWDWDDQL